VYTLVQCEGQHALVDHQEELRAGDPEPY